MQGVNVLAVVVAGVAAFLASATWYAVFGGALAKVSGAFAELRGQRPAPWRLGIVLAGSLVLSFVVAYIVGLGARERLAAAVGIGFLLWLGLSATQWVSSIVWEKVPVRMAAIHAGDWLVKLVLIAAIVGAWR
jgi:Protein of unknown function (DUF1761)